MLTDKLKEDKFYLYDLNGVQQNLIFCCWTGDEEMSTNRVQALWSILQNTGCTLALINKGNIENWILPDAPLHPAYPYLSSTHKADYLRCYMMHHYGGGYTDLKITTKNWSKFFNALRNSDYLALGYAELEDGIPHLKEREEYHHISHEDLIGLCSFIFKKHTVLTKSWLVATEQLLTAKLEQLKANPAQHPLDQTGVILPNGMTSQYPLRWAEMLGEIFHPIIYHSKERILKKSIEPFFGNYR